MSNRAINEHAYLVAYERQKIFGDLPETTAFKRYAAKHEQKSQLVSRASRIFPTCTHAHMTSGRGNPHGIFPTCTHAHMTSGRGNPHGKIRLGTLQRRYDRIT